MLCLLSIFAYFAPIDLRIRVLAGTRSPRDVKMGSNPRANPAHHGFEPGLVEIFLQISIRVDF